MERFKIQLFNSFITEILFLAWFTSWFNGIILTLESEIPSILFKYSESNNLNYVLLDVLKVPQYLQERNIKPDLVFIDAIKSYNDLYNSINAFL
mgnify:CR=1 FL=1